MCDSSNSLKPVRSRELKKSTEFCFKACSEMVRMLVFVLEPNLKQEKKKDSSRCLSTFKIVGQKFQLNNHFPQVWAELLKLKTLSFGF